MNRRSFFAKAGNLIASVAIAQSVVKSWGKQTISACAPTNMSEYCGSWQFIVGWRGELASERWLTMVEGGKFPENMGGPNPDWVSAPKEELRYIEFVS